MKSKFMIMHEDDNCATSLDAIKFSLVKVNKGDLIKKYGQIIGKTTDDIKKGDLIHTHDLKNHYLEDK